MNTRTDTRTSVRSNLAAKRSAHARIIVSLDRRRPKRLVTFTLPSGRPTDVRGLWRGTEEGMGVQEGCNEGKGSDRTMQRTLFGRVSPQRNTPDCH